MSLNPLIAKQKPNGNIQCLVCNGEVKPKIWTAHVNGKKHRDNIVRLKASSSSSSQKRAGKGAAALTEPPNKKLRSATTEPAASEMSSRGIPHDFFDEQQEIKTPFQKNSGKDEMNTVDSLPTGFFDDKKMDEQSRETREKNAHIEEEYEKWKEEIGEEQNDWLEKQEKAEAAEQRKLEIERIDEQMAALKKLNDLEIQKEKRLYKAMERRQQRKKEEEENDDEDGDGEDINLDDIDWRSKDIFS